MDEGQRAGAADARPREPPDALRAALDNGTGDLGDIASAAARSDAAAARTAAQQLVTDSQKIRDARDAFERALDDATK